MKLAAASELIPTKPKGKRCVVKSHPVQSNLALAQVRNTRFSLVSKPQTRRVAHGPIRKMFHKRNCLSQTNDLFWSITNECALYVQAVEELWRITEGILTRYARELSLWSHVKL